MSLNQFLEPVPPPAGGIDAVKRRAAKRARTARFNSIAGSVMPVLVIALVLGLSSLGGASRTKLNTVGASLSDDNSGTLTNSPNYLDVKPDSAGLPGGSTSISSAHGLAIYGLILGIALLVGANLRLLYVIRRSTVPLVPSVQLVFVLTVGTVVTAASLLLLFFS